jgi:MoaA/NifB/PqqE/SkfB family radical SAM enzyme
MVETVKDCSYPWTWMMVTAAGAVKPCCFCRGNLGNLRDAGVEEIWNGPTAIELRTFIKANKVHPMCANAPCKFVQNMRNQEAQRKETTSPA